MLFRTQFAENARFSELCLASRGDNFRKYMPYVSEILKLIGTISLLLFIGADMALLSLTNHSILSYGTYGMWGALLSGGRAILPKSFSNTKETIEILSAELPGWILMDDDS